MKRLRVPQFVTSAPKCLTPWYVGAYSLTQPLVFSSIPVPFSYNTLFGFWILQLSKEMDKTKSRLAAFFDGDDEESSFPVRWTETYISRHKRSHKSPFLPYSKRHSITKSSHNTRRELFASPNARRRKKQQRRRRRRKRRVQRVPTLSS